MAAGKKDSINLLVVANPATPELSVLQKLPAGVNIVATGQTLSDLSQQLSEEQWGSIDVMLNCGVGKMAGKRDDVKVGSSSSGRVGRNIVVCRTECDMGCTHGRKYSAISVCAAVLSSQFWTQVQQCAHGMRHQQL
jgi:hypothetical protein